MEKVAMTTKVAGNSNMAKLQAGYLFPKIARRHNAHILQKVSFPASARLFCMEGPQSDETQKVQLLRARLEESSPQSKDIDDGTLRRFLRARSLNVDKALKFLLQHLKWCGTFKPLGFIPETEIVNELKKEKIFVQGTDKTGRPIGVILATRHITSERNLEEFKRFVVYGFDKAVASLQGDQEKFVLIADLKGYGYKNMDVKGYLSILEILQDHFPERLGKFYILHVPSLFWVAWKVVYPFIDPNVRDKIVFVDDKQITETLLKDIDITQLPDEFGGQLPLIPIQHVGNKSGKCLNGRKSAKADWYGICPCAGRQ
ncbi:hypothetical protein GOP47_0000165 [Adiantum capillus-veneris]|uniref:CRAL-TRIO domain-containing protein n=1 Tax=Adiantum capillus-veneris TaxID=13818 RepID=A0A9D4ZS51_ADICA|nr:hypothetical protein GOP47_0000165 [Adiantum capillus-veneris]